MLWISSSLPVTIIFRNFSAYCRASILWCDAIGKYEANKALIAHGHYSFGPAVIVVLAWKFQLKMKL